MEEKDKSKVLIFIIVILVAIIVLMIIGGILGYRALSEKINDLHHTANVLNSEVIELPELSNDVNNEDTNQIEKQVDEELQIIGDKVAKKNILVNGKVIEIKETIVNINLEEQNQRCEVSVQIDGVETEKLKELGLFLEDYSNITISDVIRDITIIKGEDNKDYIIIENIDNLFGIYYILNEDGKIIGSFTDDVFASIEVEDYKGPYLQIGDNYIIEYEAIASTDQLKKWKYTIKNSELIPILEKTYERDEFTMIGKVW